MITTKALVLLAFVVNSVVDGKEKKKDPSTIAHFDPWSTNDYFVQFMEFFGYDFEKDFVQKEFQPSYDAFAFNVQKMNTMNNYHTTAEFRINEFTHLTLEEFTNAYTGFNGSDYNPSKALDFVYSEVGDASYLTSNIVWLGPLAKHQVFGCRNSYVYSAIALLESQIYHSFGALKELSVQQAFDCESSGDCVRGGMPHLVLETIMNMGGVLTDKQYPNRNESVQHTWGKYCMQNLTKVEYLVTAVDLLDVKDEVGLMGALYMHGPLVTAIYVSDEVKNYHSGVLDPTDCDHPPNHAVLLVGYGLGSEKVPFWQIKNSWGTKWGQLGYIRIVRGKRACNIGSYVVKISVDAKNKTNTSTVKPLIFSPEKMSTLAQAINESLLSSHHHTTPAWLTGHGLYNQTKPADATYTFDPSAAEVIFKEEPQRTSTISIVPKAFDDDEYRDDGKVAEVKQDDVITADVKQDDVRAADVKSDDESSSDLQSSSEIGLDEEQEMESTTGSSVIRFNEMYEGYKRRSNLQSPPIW